MKKCVALLALASVCLFAADASAFHGVASRSFALGVNTGYAGVPLQAPLLDPNCGVASVPFQAPLLAPNYGIQGAAFAPSYGVGVNYGSRGVFVGHGVTHFRSAAVFAPVAPVFNGGSTVVVNNQRGLFGSRSSVVVGGGAGIGGGSAVVVNSQRGLFGRNSTTVVAGGAGRGAVVVNSRR